MIETRFKKTDIGEIPEDWEVKALGEIAPLQRGFDLPTSKVQNGIVPVVYSNGICNFHNKEICKAPGLVTGRSGTIGKFTFLPSGYYWPHNTTLWVTSFNNNNPLFIYYLYSSQRFEDFSGGSGVPTLNRNDVHEKKCSIPPLPEQQRIATALGDIDALLSSLNKKIAKKKLIKQGAMQKLLTGKKRLAGFTESWEKKYISEACTIKARIGWQGLKTDEYLDYGNYVLITGTDFDNGFINWAKCSYVSKERFEQDENIKIKQGDVLITKDGSIGKVAYLNFTPMEGTLNSGVFVVRPKNSCELNNDYLALIFKSKFFEDFIAQLKAGSTIAHLYQKDFVKFQLYYPTDLAEQTAIATILSDMDKEIEGLESKRAKYEQVKQGMMQQLLTGKIRLID